jgi:hypothetical protein
VSPHFNFHNGGKTDVAMPRSEPDGGNPSPMYRVGRLAETRAMGAGLRALGKPVDEPPNIRLSAPHFYPDKCAIRSSGVLPKES